MSQEELSSKISAMFSSTFTRAQISHIENGISAPAVNIVSAIAEILEADLEVGGCRITKLSELPAGQLTVMPQQLSFPFDVERFFSAATLKLTALPENSISLQAVFTRGQQGPLKTIDAVRIKKAGA